MSGALRTSCDRKVRMYKTQENSFGCLPGPPSIGGTCVGCTSGPGGCWETAAVGGVNKVCYVDKLRKVYTGVNKVLTNNTLLLHGASLVGKMDLFDDMVDEFEDKCDRYVKRTGDRDVRNFRLYWSGDIPDISTAMALMSTIRNHPRTHFWTYTRSFEYVPTLYGTRNLKLFVSLDAVNCEEGMDRFNSSNYPRGSLSLCYMGDTNPYNFTPCPVDAGKMPLEGACRKCMLCVSRSQDKNIWFNIK